MDKFRFFLLLFFTLTLTVIFVKNFNASKEEDFTELRAYNYETQKPLGENITRDFYQYECKSMKRYGSYHPDPFFRIDGEYIKIIF